MFTYVDIYNDLSGTVTKYMPTDRVLLFYSGARCDRFFGPPELLPMIPMRQLFYQQFLGVSPQMPIGVPSVKNAGATIRPDMFYFDAYADEKWKTITGRMQAAPIYATTQTDAFSLINVDP
jgi:hypothetical protein